MTKLRQQAEDMKRQAEQDAKSGKISNEENEGIAQMANSLKEFAKLNNNSCYGKTIQSDEKFDTSVMVNSKDTYLKQTIGRGLMDFNILAPKTDNHSGSVELKLKKDKYEIKSNKGDGAAVLSISKMLMLDFIYNGPISKAYTKEEVKYMYTDTDGLIVRVVQLPGARAAPRTYEEFLQRFDETTECRLLKDRHFAKPGELTPGKMKFEKNIVEFVALSPKVYAFAIGGDKLDEKGNTGRHITKIKGISEKQNKHLEFSKYLEAYHKGIRVRGTNTMILKSNKHSKMEMVTVEQNKWALTPYDDKRWWSGKNVSIPWGYGDIEYNPNRVFARIIRNCARRVNVSITKFLSILGCTVKEFRKHIEEGMKKIPFCTLLTYKTYWNIDHTIPLSKRDLTDERILRELCHYTNLHPMTVADNSRKRNKEPKNDQNKLIEIDEIIQLLNTS
jgi:hypothetical protein